MVATLANGSFQIRQQAFSSCHRHGNRGTVHRKTVLPAPGSYSPSTPATCAASELQKQLQAQGQGSESSSEFQKRHVASVLAAAALAASILACPGAVLADDMLTTAQHAQALSMLLPAGSLAANLPAAEVPGLVADSGTAVLEGVKGIMGQGLQDLTENSMTAVGGPVTGDVVSASANQGPQAQQQPESEPQQYSSSSSLPDLVAPVQQQQQQQQHKPSLWCSAWEGYCEALKRSPLPIKVYTGIVGTLLGDLAAQVLSHTAKQKQQQHTQQQHQHGSSSGSNSSAGFHFDALRAGRLCLYSAMIGTPMSHCWYGLLESTVFPATPLAPAAVAAKVALDQLLQTPFGMALFFAVMKVLEGKPGQVQPELQSKMMPALLANWKLWPAAQLINFTLVPEDQRILYGNIVGICWTCVISNMQQASGDDQTAGSADTAELAAAEAKPTGQDVPASGSAAAAGVGRLVDAVFSPRKRSSASMVV